EESNVELEAALDDANEARNAAQSSEQRLRLLDEASRILASSLDYEKTIAAAAQVAVPHFADWCAVDLAVDGEIRRLATAHVDPDKVRWALELAARYPVDPNVIRTGQPEIVPVVTEDMLVAGARDAEELKAFHDVGIYSVMVVPLV